MKTPLTKFELDILKKMDRKVEKELREGTVDLQDLVLGEYYLRKVRGIFESSGDGIPKRFKVVYKTKHLSVLKGVRSDGKFNTKPIVAIHPPPLFFDYWKTFYYTITVNTGFEPDMGQYDATLLGINYEPTEAQSRLNSLRQEIRQHNSGIKIKDVEKFFYGLKQGDTFWRSERGGPYRVTSVSTPGRKVFASNNVSSIILTIYNVRRSRFYTACPRCFATESKSIDKF